MKRRLALLALAVAGTIHQADAAERQYGPGVTDREIKLGQTISYSGPGSSYAYVGKIQTAYFKMLNEERGGINGRAVNLLSRDDAYSPPKTVEVTRELVESDNVFAMVGSMCTPCQSSVQKYLNLNKVPQVFISASSPNLEDHQKFPWTVPFNFPYTYEAQIYARYILKNKPDAKIGVIYQDDDVGRSYLRGFKEGLGKNAAMIVKEVSYSISDPTVDSQVVAVKSAGVDTFVNFGMAKAAAQSIRKAGSLGWKPVQFVALPSQSISGVMVPAGIENAKDLLSAVIWKSPSDPAWANDKGMQDYLSFMKKYLPNENPDQIIAVSAYNIAQITALTLERCGDVLTRENFMKEATSLKDVELPMALPGVKVNISPDNVAAIREAKLARFDGSRWDLSSDLIGRGE